SHDKNIFRRFAPWVLENAAFVADMEKIAVGAVGFGLADRDRDVEFLRIGNTIRTGLEFPVSPRGDHLDVGLQGIISQLETDLVISLAGGSMSDGISGLLEGDFNLLFGNQRTGDG